MSSLYIDRRQVHLQHDSGAIAFYENGQRSGTVPLAPISRLILRGQATIEASLLGKLGELGVGVLLLSGKIGKPSLFLCRTHNDVQRRVAQTRCSLDNTFCLHIAQQLVHSKLQRQSDWLERLRQDYPAQRYTLTHARQQLLQRTAEIPQARTLDRLRGLEGSAAADYFAGLRCVVPPSLGFNNRNRRPPRDPFNALLSLTYTIITAEIAMALHSAGFDPYIGYYHQIHIGRESLACDLMDPLRALADRLCLHIVAKQKITAADFSTDKSGCNLGKAGRVRYYEAYEEQGNYIRKAIDQDIRTLAAQITPNIDVAPRQTLADMNDPGTWQNTERESEDEDEDEVNPTPPEPNP